MKKNILKSKSRKIVFYWLYIPAIFLIVIITLVSYHFKINISFFTRDPMAITGNNPFLGLISNIGIILWSFSVAICFFSYTLLKIMKKRHNSLEFIMFGGTISFLLLSDDLLMLHEKVFPKIFRINEKILFLFYGGLILFYLLKFREKILENDILLILSALFFFGFSIVIDALPDSLLPWHYLFEDGLKFFGIVSWLGFQFSICSQEFHSIIDITPFKNNIKSDI